MSPGRVRVGKAVGLAAICATVAWVSGCGGDDDSASPKGDGKDQVRIALLLPSTASAYYRAVADGVKSAALKENASVRVLDSNFDPQKELGQCQDVIASGTVDAIVIEPVDNTSTGPCARAAVNAKLPIVSVEAPIGPDWNSEAAQVDGVTGSVFGFAGSAGERLAKLAGEACGDLDPCRLVYELGNAGYSYDTSLLAAFKDNLAPNIEIAQQVQTNFQPDEALTKTRAVLDANSDIDVIAVTEDTTAGGAVRAVEQTGLAGKVKIVSAGGSKSAVEQIKAGAMVGSVPYVPSTDGKLALEIAAHAARGEPIEKPFVDSFDLTSVELVTKDTIGDWTPEY